MPTKTNLQTTFAPNLLKDLRDIIASGRAVAYASVNAAMIDTYWKIGRRIVEEEQHGSKRAEYGTGLLNELSAVLTAEFGKGYGVRNLAYYKQLYQFFPDPMILHTRGQNLTWSHVRALLRVADETARLWYLNEASRDV